MELSASRTENFTAEERDPRNYWIGVCMGPRTNLDSGEEKNHFTATTNQALIT